ncbi:scopoletin glucosyltransferase-like [Iris pallida]|uniref:Scopoletin glucosyltransferase-like n=1 Tax=Iris pallida TaxID=29817 RepID=A0AAX6HDR4_IRIPA|nr:scopoletin glucosyltransferase-like [Iris pallida]KAJ6848954.1 scopoletin glucosyltransferase-like [Iris pallida]
MVAASTSSLSSGYAVYFFTPTDTPIFSTSTISLSLQNCSANRGHVTSGRPALTPSRVEFHPQCVTNPPTDAWLSISTCGAHPLTIRPRPRTLSSKAPSGTHLSLLTTQTNGWLDASRPRAISQS